MANIVDKYFGRKKKQIYNYSKLINELLTYNDNQIWNTTGELSEFLKLTISLYIDKYYFKFMDNFDEYDEYLGALKKCDNRFKTILVCTYISLPEDKRLNKLSAYIISLIVYAAVALDRFTYPYNNYKINIKNVTSIVEPLLRSVSFVGYKENSNSIRELSGLVKKNDNLESKFFYSLNSINSEESKNLYESVDDNKKYYKIIYKYKIPELDNYRSKDVEKYFRRIVDDMNTISYELVTIAALKNKMLSRNFTFLFPVNLEFYEKASEVNKLFKVTKNDGIKDVIKFYVRYNNYKEHSNIIRILANSGFKMAMDFEVSEAVPYGTFNEIKIAIVDDEFLKLNKGNIETWKNNGVQFIKKNVGDPISELAMLGLEEEK